MAFEIQLTNDSSYSGNTPLLFAESDTELKEPKSYNVILLNDDYTSMEFVVEILVHIFSKTESSAHTIMLNIHNDGRAIVGVFPKEIAEAKRDKTLGIAQANEFPLRCIIEHV